MFLVYNAIFIISVVSDDQQNLSIQSGFSKHPKFIKIYYFLNKNNVLVEDQIYERLSIFMVNCKLYFRFRIKKFNFYKSQFNFYKNQFNFFKGVKAEIYNFSKSGVFV